MYEEKIKKDLYKILCNVYSSSDKIKNISPDTDFKKEGMDSIMFVELIIEIENHFKIDFPYEKMTLKQAGSIKAICEIISSLKYCKETAND
ncbi:MAG TPA: hypothetical protein DCP51_05750 [Clostridiales bacterium]|nr:MAG: hypothetical protein A2Y40_00965 [Candidatus Margulisbacteria bacterium GWF2_35_9]HAN21164.1 hypothetical protein [Clostridiales bacterium]